jgi:hypothetical protein
MPGRPIRHRTQLRNTPLRQTRWRRTRTSNRLPEGLAQRRDMDPQRALVDHRVGPCTGDELLLWERLAGAFDQRDQNVQRATAEAQRLLIVEHDSLRRHQPERSREQEFGASLSRSQTFRGLSESKRISGRFPWGMTRPSSLDRALGHIQVVGPAGDLPAGGSAHENPMPAHAKCSNKLLASCRSAVAKPSVKRP